MTQRSSLKDDGSGWHSSNRLEKFHEAFIEHKTSKSRNWTKIWLVLRGQMLFAFKSPKTSIQDQLIGCLMLNHYTQCKIAKPTGKKASFKFLLITVDPRGSPIMNRFRCETRMQRDIWRAFIMGLAIGKLPDDVLLPPSQIQSIAAAIDKVKRSQSFGGGTLNGGSTAGTINRPQTSTSERTLVHGNGAKPASEALFVDDDDEPRAPRHNFYDNTRLNHNIPSWFYESCSREIAEQVLTEGTRFGNCLMRESTTYRDTGSYTISLRNPDSSRTRFSHFQVFRTVSGYKIQFDYQHSPFACLAETMAYFREVSAADPMRTNDLTAILNQSSATYDTSTIDIAETSYGPNGRLHRQRGPKFQGNHMGTQKQQRSNSAHALSHTSRSNLMSHHRQGSRMGDEQQLVAEAFDFLDVRSCHDSSDSEQFDEFGGVPNGERWHHGGGSRTGGRRSTMLMDRRAPSCVGAIKQRSFTSESSGFHSSGRSNEDDPNDIPGIPGQPVDDAVYINEGSTMVAPPPPPRGSNLLHHHHQAPRIPAPINSSFADGGRRSTSGYTFTNGYG